MKISNNRKIKDIQKEFNRYFPFLHLEFYSKPHDPGQASDQSNILNPNHTLGEICDIPPIGYIPLNGSQKVNEFEQLFAKAFGLNVQVFRKSHGKWLQTWATDIWTLEEQNNRGRILGNQSA